MRSRIKQAASRERNSGSSRSSEAGFTLLEVIIAFALLTFMMTGVLYMGTISSTANTRSEDEAAAVAHGIDKIEQLKNAGFSQLSVSSFASSVCPTSETLGIYSRSCSIGSQYSLAGVPAKDLTVTVQWTGGGSVTLTTTIINPPTMSSGALEQFPTVAVKSWNSQ